MIRQDTKEETSVEDGVGHEGVGEWKTGQDVSGAD